MAMGCKVHYVSGGNERERWIVEDGEERRSVIERSPKNQTDLATYTSCGSVVMAPDGKRVGGSGEGEGRHG